MMIHPFNETETTATTQKSETVPCILLLSSTHILSLRYTMWKKLKKSSWVALCYHLLKKKKKSWTLYSHLSIGYFCKGTPKIGDNAYVLEDNVWLEEGVWGDIFHCISFFTSKIYFLFLVHAFPITN